VPNIHYFIEGRSAKQCQAETGSLFKKGCRSLI